MTFKVSKSILMLKRHKIGGSKWTNFDAKKGKKFGQNRGSHDFQSKLINFNAKKAKNLGKIGGSKWINLNAKKGKKFGQI